MTAQSRTQDSSVHGGRLISVSNRLPVILSRRRDGRWQADPGSAEPGGLWIGWPGVVEEEGIEHISEVLEREAVSPSSTVRISIFKLQAFANDSI